MSSEKSAFDEHMEHVARRKDLADHQTREWVERAKKIADDAFGVSEPHVVSQIALALAIEHSSSWVCDSIDEIKNAVEFSA